MVEQDQQELLEGWKRCSRRVQIREVKSKLRLVGCSGWVRHGAEQRQMGRDDAQSAAAPDRSEARAMLSLVRSLLDEMKLGVYVCLGETLCW
jgi:hypothetical protein